MIESIEFFIIIIILIIIILFNKDTIIKKKHKKEKNKENFNGINSSIDYKENSLKNKNNSPKNEKIKEEKTKFKKSPKSKELNKILKKLKDNFENSNEFKKYRNTIIENLDYKNELLSILVLKTLEKNEKTNLNDFLDVFLENFKVLIGISELLKSKKYKNSSYENSIKKININLSNDKNIFDYIKELTIGFIVENTIIKLINTDFLFILEDKKLNKIISDVFNLEMKYFLRNKISINLEPEMEIYKYYLKEKKEIDLFKSIKKQLYIKIK